MTPDQWLQKHGRKPWTDDEEDAHYHFWYWRAQRDYEPEDPENDPDEIDFILPNEVYDRMKSRPTYPRVKMYKTEAEALVDFRYGYQKAIEEGWIPQ